jgi:hypothetical protein
MIYFKEKSCQTCLPGGELCLMAVYLCLSTNQKDDVLKRERVWRFFPFENCDQGP